MKIALNAIPRFIAVLAMRSMLFFVALATANLWAVVWDPLDESGGFAHWDDLYLAVQIDRPKRGEATVCFSDIECVYPNGHMWIPTVPSVLPIPSECNGVPVTTISRRALSPLWVAEGTDITGSPPYLWERGVSSIVIPESVVTIEDEAFCGNPVLRTVSLPSGLQSLGEYVFSGCTALASASIPSHIADLPTGLFARCSGLQTVLLPRGLKNIGVYSFRNCSALSSLSIPDSVEAIGGYAFENCSALTSVSIPASVKEIGEGAFRGCSSLQTIHFPTNFYGKTDTLGIPTGCTIVFGEPLALVVSSSIDRTVPKPGVVSLFKGASVTCRAETFEDDDHPGFQYECLGWAGSGSVPAFGAGTEVSFVLESESSITWNWRTNVWIDCVLSGEVSPVAVAQYQPLGESLVVPFEIGTTNASVVFSGDADGVDFDPVAKTVSIPADRPRTLSVQIGYGTRVFTHMVLSPQSGGDVEWRMESNAAASDGYCFRSGEIEQGETSTMELHVEGSGVLSFDWMVSANRSDWAYFYVDGNLAASITRSTEWANVSTNLADGAHVLRWVFDRHAAAAANAEAAFLDNISWRPWLTLTVSSTFGTPSPAVGTTRVSYGDLVSASVVAPAAANGTRLVCTGWTGSGSVPTEGASSSVQFVMTKSTTLVWRWRTNHWIDASVDSGGSTSFQPQWAEHGSTVVIPLVSATHLFDVSLSGDTDGVTVSGASVQIPADKTRTVHIAMSEIKLPLVVANEHGDSLPEAGAHSLSWGTFVMASASDPDPASGFSYHCTGWRGTGSVPSEGVGSVARFTMEEPSTLSWLWQTNFWVELSVQGAIAVDVSGSWVSSGESLVVPYAPLSDYATIVASGDADGVVINATAQTITIPADRPRSVIINASAMSLASALDATGLVWTTSGSDVWIPQREFSSDGVDAAESGDATGGDNFLETTVLGPGTLSWFWKMNTTGWAGVDASVDNCDVAYLETAGEWASASTQITGDGPHAVRFAFWTEEGCSSSDRAYLDRVSWTGTIAPRTTTTTPETVPYAWLDQWPGLLAAHGNDYERTASATAANGMNSVWECYVAGLDPTDPASAFLVNITMEDGEPQIDWTPDLGAARNYLLEGRTDLGTEEVWDSPPKSTNRFFRARVSLPSDCSLSDDNDFPGIVSVTLDAQGGTVSPDIIQYYAPGRLGILPKPIGGEWTFCGWYSSINDGVRITGKSLIPNSDMTLYARWDAPGISFHPNGGEGTMPTVRSSGGTFCTLPACAFRRHGYSFAGWSTSPNGAVFVEDCATIEVRDHLPGQTLILYAVWTPNLHTISFDTAGGTAISPIECVYGAKPMAPANPTRLDYDFAGWSPAIPNVMPDEDLLLTARWTPTIQRHGLMARYYESGWTTYSALDAFNTWIESEEMMLNSFLFVSPTVTTNTVDWGLTLEPGKASPTNKFHSVYGDSAKNGFNILLTGYLEVDNPGTYSFSSWGVDGLVLYIDGALVSHNLFHYYRPSGNNSIIECFDYNHGNGSIDLSRGLHRICIAFCGVSGDQEMWIQWKKPGSESMEPLPQTALFRECPVSNISPRNGCGSLTLQFVANGGTGTMPSTAVDCFFGTGILAIPNCRFSQEGFVFVGWSLSADGEIEWTDGESLSSAFFERFKSGVVTLYARWSRGAYTVRFDANGGTGTMPDISLWTDVPQQLPRNAFTHEGMIFVGWGPDFGGKVVHPDGAIVTNLTSSIDGVVTLRAQWIQGNGGLCVRYYDQSSSGYSTWTQSEDAMKEYFATLTPTIVTNTVDWEDGLDTGFSSSIGTEGNNWVSSGMTRPNSTCRFHDKYCNGSTSKFAILATGWVRIDRSGIIEFAAVADDAIVVYVDGEKILDNESNWGAMATGEQSLSAGWHSISVGFYEASGGQGLSVQWRKSGAPFYVPIPLSVQAIDGLAVRISFNANGGEGTPPTNLVARPGGLLTMPENTFTRSGYTFRGWTALPDGEPIYQPGDEVSFDACATLYASWSSKYYIDGESGLVVRYYDISSSGYPLWTQSEDVMMEYFAPLTPTIVTNTIDWGFGLDAGFSSSIGTEGNNWVSSGMTRPSSSCHFHGKYSNRSTSKFAILATGLLQIEESGIVQFAAVADDAVVVYIDGEKILDNGSSWGTMSTGEKTLSAGWHSISVGFYEASGGQGLSVQWRKAGNSSYTPIAQSVLFVKSPVVRVSFNANGGGGNPPADLIAELYDPVIMPTNTFTRESCEFRGWASLPDGEPLYQPGDAVVFDACAVLYASWYVPGLAVRYYDSPSSGYSEWTQSEEAMTSYFAGLTPSIVTNTLEWGSGLDAGFNELPGGSDWDRWVSFGLTMPSSPCVFHAPYATKSRNQFSALLTGYLFVSDSGTYQFAAVADDSVVLYVDGEEILGNEENWGSVATGGKMLSAGWHSISIAFYEASGGQGLSVQWRKSGETYYEPIPQLFLFHSLSITQ